MENEEKAKEIAEKNAIIYDAEEDTANGLIYPTIHSTKECEKSALEMAEWKDEKFKEYLEKKMCEYEEKRDAVRRNGINDYAHLIFDTKATTYREIINELFK